MVLGDYFRVHRESICVDGHVSRGGDFLLWGEPGLRRFWGCLFSTFLRGLRKACRVEVVVTREELRLVKVAVRDRASKSVPL
jgi:hypothetical protein